MNLRQLQYVREIARNGLSISKAAKQLNTSQPGVSQQILALERELGVDIFLRDKNRLTGLTQRGQGVLEHAEAALFNVDCVYSISKSVERRGSKALTIATSHSQARYLLPRALGQFAASHPNVQLNVLHDLQSNMLGLLMDGKADVAITTTVERSTDDVIMLQCYENRRVVVTPLDHPLLRAKVTFAEVAKYDLITYDPSIPTRRLILETFARNGAVPRVRLSAIDADIIKAFVAQGLGVTILPEMTIDPRTDPDLAVITSPILFPPSITSVIVNRRRPISPQTIEFIKVFCPTVSLPAALAERR